jgi:hypothetical protein
MKIASEFKNMSLTDRLTVAVSALAVVATVIVGLVVVGHFLTH